MVVLRSKLFVIYCYLRAALGALPRALPKHFEGKELSQESHRLSIIWFAYPVVFLIGQQGLRLWSPVIDAALFTSLDLIAKVLYGLWAVSMLKHPADVREELPESGDRLVRGRA